MSIVFSFDGETATRRAKDILDTRGIRAELIRLSLPGKGCRFGLRVRAADRMPSERILYGAHIRFSVTNQ